MTPGCKVGVPLFILPSQKSIIWEKYPRLEACRHQLTFEPIDQRVFEKYIYFIKPAKAFLHGTKNLCSTFRKKNLGTQRVNEPWHPFISNNHFNISYLHSWTLYPEWSYIFFKLFSFPVALGNNLISHHQPLWLLWQVSSLAPLIDFILHSRWPSDKTPVPPTALFIRLRE